MITKNESMASISSYFVYLFKITRRRKKKNSMLTNKRQESDEEKKIYIDSLSRILTSKIFFQVNRLVSPPLFIQYKYPSFRSVSVSIWNV